MARYQNKTIIFAPNIRGGGGLVLLKQILPHLLDKDKYFLILHDDLNRHIEKPASNVKFFGGNLRSRVSAELFAWRAAGKNNQLFCFHSLPTLFGLRQNCHVYFHNLNMLQPNILFRHDKWNYMRSKAEGLLLKLLHFKINTIYSQSEIVSNLLEKHVPLHANSYKVAPFNERPRNTQFASIKKKHSYQLLYPANNSPHKNHDNLFLAACLLEDKLPNLKIMVTLSDTEFALLSSKFPSTIMVNTGACTHDAVLSLLVQYDGLIFPSLTESLGLPLVEAQTLGVDILASELDYVRNICEPIVTFNPLSPLSISRAILRFYNKNDLPVSDILTSDSFVNNILDKI